MEAESRLADETASLKNDLQKARDSISDLQHEKDSHSMSASDLSSELAGKNHMFFLCSLIVVIFL